MFMKITSINIYENFEFNVYENCVDVYENYVD